MATQQIRLCYWNHELIYYLAIVVCVLLDHSPDDSSLECEDKVVSLGGKNTVHVKKHDRLTIFTPGGGGYGRAGDTPRTDPWQVDDTAAADEQARYDTVFTMG